MEPERRILVTGAGGFIGQWVMKALRSRPHVIAIRNKADLLNGSPESEIARTRPDTILHLAWFVKHGWFWNAAENEQWAEATARLAKIGAEHGVKRFVGVGTCAEYDWKAPVPFQEYATPIAPATPYGQFKVMAHDAVSHTGALSVAWGRLFFLYGFREDPRRLVPSIAASLRAGEPALCGSGIGIRDFLDVRDVGEALATIALSDIEGPVNVASGEGVSIATVVNTLGELSGRPDLIRIGALADRPNEPPAIIADVARLRSIGFRPARTLREGLADVLRAY